MRGKRQMVERKETHDEKEAGFAHAARGRGSKPTDRRRAQRHALAVPAEVILLMMAFSSF